MMKQDIKKNAKEKMRPLSRADFNGMLERAAKPPVQKPSPKSK
jgi:hypothetical protein